MSDIQPLPALPHAQYERFESVRELEDMFDELIPQTQSVIRIFDRSLSARYNTPMFTSALRSLQETAAAAEKAVAEQTTLMHAAVDRIGPLEAMDDVKSMHSLLPRHYRDQLRLYSADQLLTLLDVLSFEEGVVEAVSRSIKARREQHRPPAEAATEGHGHE